jgi:hypothetical protein
MNIAGEFSFLGSSCARRAQQAPANARLAAERAVLRPCQRAGGFTLLETLLAVALSAALLIAVNFFVLSMGELWGRTSEPRLFDRHVRGVTRFLEALVQQSVATEASPGATTPGGGKPQAKPQASGGSAPGLGRLVALVFGDGIRRPTLVGALAGPRAGFLLASLGPRTPTGPQPSREGGVGRIPEGVRNTGTNMAAGGATAAGSAAPPGSPDATGPRFRVGTPAGYDGAPPMLIFEVDEAPGQCVWPLRPLPQVECALQINADEGLVLLWKSKLEEDYGKGRPRKTQLSPLGQSMAFEYYDAERKSWTRSEQPQPDGEGGWLVPQRLHLIFAYAGMSREVSILLPGAPGGAPMR